MDLMEHAKIKSELEGLLKEIPSEKSQRIMNLVGDLYESFADVLRIEQSKGVATGLAQSAYGDSAIVKVDLDLPDKQKPYELEQIPFGSAKIKVLKTQQGKYGLHGQTGWDDAPYWKIWDAWIITSQAYGNIDWGPFKQRRNSKKEYKGTSQISILEAEILDDENKAKEKARDLSTELEQKGFKTRTEVGEDYEPRILKTQYKLDVPLKDFIQRQFHPRLKNVYLKESERRWRKWKLKNY